MRKYHVYGRHSGDHQTDGSSKERQLDMDAYRRRASKLAEELGEPIEFVEKAYYDDAKSGFYGDNLEAELGRMFADIRSGVIGVGDIIGTESHSRLGRLEPGEALYQYLDCPASAPMRQNRQVEEGRISGPS
jgi:DNA invertase Pin-like site-specific DNA recombinase